MFPLRGCLVCAEWKAVWAVVDITRGKKVLVFSPKIKVFSKKKGLHFDFIPDFIPKIKLFSKKKKKVFTSIPWSLIFYFVSGIKPCQYLYSALVLPILMQRKLVLPIIMQCVAKRKYFAGVPSLLRGRAAAQLRGNYGRDPKVGRHLIWLGRRQV